MRPCLFKRTIETRQGDSLVCVCLDPLPGKLPTHLDPEGNLWAALRHWAYDVVDATAEHSLCYKLGFWHWVSQGPDGLAALIDVVRHIHDRCHPSMPVILDYGFGGTGTACERAVELAFRVVGADAVTVVPYVGIKAFEPFFVQYPDKGIIVVDKTSGPGFEVPQYTVGMDGWPLFMRVAIDVAEVWNAEYGNFALAVAAGRLDVLREIRSTVGNNLPLLVTSLDEPNCGVTTVFPSALDSHLGGVMAASSAIAHASSGRDFAKAAARAAERLKLQINAYRRP